jgi:hypothetical protein
VSKPNWYDLQAATEQAKKDLGERAPSIDLLKRSRQLLSQMQGRRLERERLLRELGTDWGEDSVMKGGKLYVPLPAVLERVSKS